MLVFIKKEKLVSNDKIKMRVRQQRGIYVQAPFADRQSEETEKNSQKQKRQGHRAAESGGYTDSSIVLV
jgi:hypothetical protein